MKKSFLKCALFIFINNIGKLCFFVRRTFSVASKELRHVASIFLMLQKKCFVLVNRSSISNDFIGSLI